MEQKLRTTLTRSIVAESNHSYCKLRTKKKYFWGRHGQHSTIWDHNIFSNKSCTIVAKDRRKLNSGIFNTMFSRVAVTKRETPKCLHKCIATLATPTDWTMNRQRAWAYPDFRDDFVLWWFTTNNLRFCKERNAVKWRSNHFAAYPSPKR